MSSTDRDNAMFVSGEEERARHPLRIHGPATHRQCYECAEREVVGHLLPQTAP